MKRKSRGKALTWLEQIIQWMDANQSRLPEPNFLKGEFPEWVQRVARELVSTVFPFAKLRVGQPWTAGQVGALLGHQLAYFHGLQHCQNIPCNKPFTKIDKRIAKRVSRQFENFAKASALALKRSLALASEQSHPEATRFFGAFAKALNKMPSDSQASNFHRTTTKVYWILLLAWPSVAKVKSVHELQQGLCKYLDPHIVGDLKRIEKICHRMGLHFGPVGRRKKGTVQVT